MESKHPAGPGREGGGLEPLLRRPQPLERPTRAPLGRRHQRGGEPRPLSGRARGRTSRCSETLVFFLTGAKQKEPETE